MLKKVGEPNWGSHLTLDPSRAHSHWAQCPLVKAVSEVVGEDEMLSKQAPQARDLAVLPEEGVGQQPHCL